MGEHTPGPWHVRFDQKAPDVFGFSIYDSENLGEQICGFDEFDNLDDDHVHHIEANARLISAAPDLLAACEATLRHISSNQVYDKDSRSILERAVAKANSTKTEDPK